MANWRIILFVKARADQVQKMLVDAGVTIVASQPPFAAAIRQPHLNFAIIDREAHADPRVVELLAQRTVNVVATSYISDYLIKGVTDIGSYHPTAVYGQNLAKR